MYFNNIAVFDVNKYIKSQYNIYAHTKEINNQNVVTKELTNNINKQNNIEKEPLYEHLKLSVKYFQNIVKDKNIEQVFENIEHELIGENNNVKNIFREMIINIIAMHDFGKVNAYFQKSKMNNNLNIKNVDNGKYSNHSLLSAVLYIDYYFKCIEGNNNLKDEEKDLMEYFLVLNSYIISRHHTDLNSLKSYKKLFEVDGAGYSLLVDRKILYETILNYKVSITIEDIQTMFDNMEYYIEDKDKYFDIGCYVYQRLLLSLLFTSDYYATSDFINNITINNNGALNNIDDFYNTLENTQINTFIRNYEKNKYGKTKDFTNIEDINTLRNELFLDAEKELEDNMDSNIFYLEAPTGSGKSNTAFNLSFKLLKEDKTKNKIFYVYPFNTLVEQNTKTLKKVFSNKGDLSENKDSLFNHIAIINSIVPVKLDKDKKYNNSKNEQDLNNYYEKALLNRQFLNYPIVLTTHVSLFSYLFGVDKEAVFPVHQLANSVIVLDEIQSYKNFIWGEIITFLSMYAKLLNIKIIIMSATLPNLDLLNTVKNHTIKTVKLIKDRDKYYNNKLFKDRVKLDYSLIKDNYTLEELKSHVKSNINNKKILIEFITKNKAHKFYDLLIEDNDICCEVELMTGEDNIAERERILDKISNSKVNEPLILVATQVIEAGVDIDMDIGYKNISMFDSEEQFLGRINRSCKKSGKVYFFNIENARSIYKNDIRVNKDLTLVNNQIRDMLDSKLFNDYYNVVIDRLKQTKHMLNKDNIEMFFNNDVKNLDYINIYECMKLINDDNNKISIYLSSKLNLNDEILDGDKIWTDYVELLKNNTMNYSERIIKLSQVRSRMNNFIYEIRWKEDFTYNDRVGDLYYIENGYKYFTNGKFDLESFKKGIGDFI